ncbi:MAG: UTP--glucose-1-phosphate uridylyltransferase [Candidatus Brocadiia bacterium]
MSQKPSEKQQKTIQRVRSAGQDHVLKWIDDLSSEQKQQLLSQLKNIDFGKVSRLTQQIGRSGEEISFEEVEPAPVNTLPQTAEEKKIEEDVAALGHEAFEAGRVAALVVAGGQGTRLGYDGPKGAYPIMPVTGKSLFHVLAGKVLAARRRYDTPIPWLVMTSPTNDDQTRDFFETKNYFGLGKDTVHFFSQNTNPILGKDGQLLLKNKGKLLVGPDGHGGVFSALSESGLAEDLLKRGFDLVSYFQVDNPLVTVADERYVGHHLRRHADFSCKVIPKRDPSEGLGIAVLKNDQPGIIEYIDLPDELAEQTDKDGELLYKFGSIAVHIIDTEFALEIGRRNDALPWHVARKNYEHLDENGNARPGECYKFEKFVFDCLPHVSDCAFVEARREREFAPVKNAEGSDSPESCRKLLRQEWLRWLENAGIDTTPVEKSSGQVEIDPRFAANEEELVRHLPDDFQPEPLSVLQEERQEAEGT